MVCCFYVGNLLDRCRRLFQIKIFNFHNLNEVEFGYLEVCFVTNLFLLHFTRSEEHTSELQSHVKLVCRLLLEKKKVNHCSSSSFGSSSLGLCLPRVSLGISVSVSSVPFSLQTTCLLAWPTPVCMSAVTCFYVF